MTEKRPSFVPFSDLWDALSEILEDPYTQISDKNRKAGLMAIELAQISVARQEDPSVVRARELYASDEIEIDDLPMLSPANDGKWVSAWLWVSFEDMSIYDYARAKGWEVEETGGGCTALAKYVDGGHMWLTDASGANAPEFLLDGPILGVYDEAGDTVCVLKFETVAEALDHVSSS